MAQFQPYEAPILVLKINKKNRGAPGNRIWSEAAGPRPSPLGLDYCVGEYRTDSIMSSIVLFLTSISLRKKALKFTRQNAKALEHLKINRDFKTPPLQNFLELEAHVKNL